MVKKQSLGKIGEVLAKKYLIEKGYRFIEANFKTPFGEIDLIFTHQNTLIFVEVKTRLSPRFGAPVQAISPYKITKLKRAAQIFSEQNPHLPTSFRLDALSLEFYRQSSLKKINHFTNIS